MDYLESIARVTSHIPEKGQVMIRYYGIYANAHRGKKKKAGVDPSCPPIIFVSFLIAIASVSSQFVKATRANPVEALRYE